MVTYGCLAILFLFVLIKGISLFFQGRKPVTSEDSDRTLYTILNGERD